MRIPATLIMMSLLVGCSHAPSLPGMYGRQPINTSGQVIGTSPVSTRSATVSRAAPRLPINTADQTAYGSMPDQGHHDDHGALAAAATERRFRVHFPSGGTRFHPEAGVARDLAIAAPGAHRITIFGRTDASSPSAADEQVALTRAREARKYLVRLGVRPERIFLQYLSAGDYLGDNTTPFGRSQNRRVDIHVQ